MKKIFGVVLVCFIVLAVAMTGCAQTAPKSTSSQEAITQAQALTTVPEKVKYLVGQANAFLNSKQFDQAINTAQYILSNLDASSLDAKSIIEKAKAELQKAGQKALSDVTGKLGSFGK